MTSFHRFPSNRAARGMGLGISLGVAALILIGWLWGPGSISPARADPGTFYVDGASGNDIPTCGTTVAPCETISYTLNTRASNGDILRVAQGVYTENLQIQISLTLAGGYEAVGWTRNISAYVTTLNGSGSHFSTLFVQNAAVMVEGFTITGGHPITGNMGGGLSAWASTITISQTLFKGNSTNENGGGVRTGDTNLLIVDSRFADNQAGQCGGGVWNGHNGIVRVVNSLITGNSSNGCGEGLMAFQTSLELINSTVADNYNPGGDWGNGIWVDLNSQADRHVNVTNSILWNNDGCNLCIGNDPNPTPIVIDVRFSDVGGGVGWNDTLFPGIGLIDTNPWFVDASQGDYHLQAWSPAIDNGTVEGAPNHDLEGNPRPLNAGFDMGAYEFTGTPVLNEGTRYVATTGSDAGGIGNSGPNLCLDAAAPCQTVGHALLWANAGEPIQVAGGTYTENLTIFQNTHLLGGYEPVGWTRDLTRYETILHGAGTITVPWDSKNVGRPSVLYEGGVYQMWYDGTDVYGTRRIGTATSPDGLQWTRQANPVLAEGAPGEWDEHGVESATVIKDGATYKMWYIASDGTGNVWWIGYATSSDGLSWTKYAGNPVLSAGTQTWNNSAVIHSSILKEDGIYKMWVYTTGNDGSGIAPYMAYATSPDGIAWTWGPDNPLFVRDFEGWFWRPNVIHTGGDYQMWYSLWNGQNSIGYATAPNEETWTKQGVILEGTPGGWDDGNAANPAVIYANGTYTMWYSSNTAIGMVTSTNGITWTKTLTGPVLGPEAPAEWGDPVVNINNDFITVELDGLTITGGDGYQAGGIQASMSFLILRNCLIEDNIAYGDPSSWASGGVLGGWEVKVFDSQIVNNRGGDGSSGLRPINLVMENSLVAGDRGAPAIHTNAEASLLNVTLVNNEGGILFNPEVSRTLLITNSIIYSNGWSIQLVRAGEAQVTYTDIEGGWPGASNIDANPGFVNPTNGDYHLQAGSPAIDVGTNTGAPNHDLDGTLRPQDGDGNGSAITDMGAFELWFFKIFLPMMLRQ